MYVPNKAKTALQELGAQIKMARKRRLWTINELASKIDVSAPTVIALEKGEATVSVGVLVSALWTLGLERELTTISQPVDTEGMKMMNARLPKKVRVSRKNLNNDF